MYAYCPFYYGNKLIQQKKKGKKRGKGKGQMANMRKKDEVKYEEMIFCNLIFFIVIL
jgi:hypothetical protein